MTSLLPVPVLLAVFGAAVTLVLPRRPGLQRFVSILSISCMIGVAAVLMWFTNSHGPLALWLGGWEVPLGISLVADRLSALMLLVAAVVALCVLIFATGQDRDEVRRETPVSIFHPTFLLLMAGVSNAFLAGDLFNLFVGFEILLFASYVLLTLGGTPDRIRAGTTYVIVSLLSSSLFLISIASIYAATGTVNMAQISIRLEMITEPIRLLLEVLLVVTFSIKAAVFPLSSWLPDSYPTAPAPVTAVFAGLLTKVGVYALIRTETLLFPGTNMHGILMVVALATMVIGILGAVAQVEIKRMLSFTLISHIGYMIFGIALNTDEGMAATIFYTAHHITIQATLFLVTGLIERRGGTSSLDGLGGLLKVAPMLAFLFFIPAMNLAGIPPMSGFVGKLGLLQAGASVGTPLAWAVVAGGVTTSLLTLMAMAKVWNRAFWGVTPREQRQVEARELELDLDPDELDDDTRPMPPVQVGATLALVLFGMALMVFAGPLYEYTTAAAEALRDGSYVNAVLPEGLR
ncbi:Na+/H+ antiporter subunit D [Tessaracoccus flavus]|uniref:Na+/H+ antiporter subunit D n=1 Tax=Tessaracoccus flavus TaxID=1610493 RepID=A0A1Q2CIC3_9ACTN|nr:Na+/H+ antiporter subunit D [Tessaracoccus flavus]AQP45861.1 Na+/H+ antiporter subunit D [Tessaracoccus flavus]SDZ06961.1 multisubunit sodium/proton antiporter, MrpD subunit [Tessaracoccus flavus]